MLTVPLPPLEESQYYTDYAHVHRNSEKKLKEYKVESEHHQAHMRRVERAHYSRSKKMGLSWLRVVKGSCMELDQGSRKWITWLCDEYGCDEWFSWFITALHEQGLNVHVSQSQQGSSSPEPPQSHCSPKSIPPLPH